MPFEIMFTEGPEKGRKSILRPNQGTILGRSPSANVMVHDQNVSRNHCVIRVEDDHCVIEDLGSTNGTYVNGQRTVESELRPGDFVRIGVNRFQLLGESQLISTDTTQTL